MGHRRKARVYALQGLYMFDVSEKSVEEIVLLDWVDYDISQDIHTFSEDLIRGTIKNLTEIDETIVSHSKNWKFERIAAVDKAILRISIFALIFLKTIPAAVTIDEAIELSKIYSGEGAGQFINGILDAVRKSLTDEKE